MLHDAQAIACPPIDIREKRRNLPPVIREEAVAKPTTNEQVLQGTLDLLILKALSLGPLHGYGIIQRIRQMSDELLEVEQGSLYPAVYRIEQRGWVSSKWGVTETGRKAKFYTLTRAGRKQLTAEEESWDRLALAIAKVRQAV
jgi:PadR family transcriptional regulator, regulatory protein PadR